MEMFHTILLVRCLHRGSLALRDWDMREEVWQSRELGGVLVDFDEPLDRCLLDM